MDVFHPAYKHVAGLGPHELADLFDLIAERGALDAHLDHDAAEAALIALDDVIEALRKLPAESTGADPSQEVARYRWLLAQPMYPTWKGIAACGSPEMREQAIAQMMEADQ